MDAKVRVHCLVMRVWHGLIFRGINGPSGTVDAG